jgi:hypothetical protein
MQALLLHFVVASCRRDNIEVLCFKHKGTYAGQTLSKLSILDKSHYMGLQEWARVYNYLLA